MAKAVTEDEIKTGGVAADRLRSLVERIERLEEERKALGSDIKDILRRGEIRRLRRQGPSPADPDPQAGAGRGRGAGDAAGRLSPRPGDVATEVFHCTQRTGSAQLPIVKGGGHEIRLFHAERQRYRDNTRPANAFIADIVDEAIHADALGMHSAWIGEHHFNSLGVLSCPDLVLTWIASRTQRIRLAPAVTVLPLHHPIRVAEQWATLDLLSGGRVDWAAGRGYDRREYEPLGIYFDDNQSIFAEGMELVRRLWEADGPISHEGRHYRFQDVSITPKPMQRPLPAYVASFSKPSIELAGPTWLRADCRAFRRRDDATAACARSPTLYHDTCARYGTAPQRLMCSYFIHFADDAAVRSRRARAADPLLQGMRHSGLSIRSGHDAAELPVLRSRWWSGCRRCGRRTWAKTPC